MNSSAQSRTIPADPGDDASWTLAASHDQEALMRLQAFLAANRHQAVSISAAPLRRPDTLLLQLLVAACRDWSARGLPFRLADTPDRVLAALPILGLRPDMIGIEAS